MPVHLEDRRTSLPECPIVVGYENAEAGALVGYRRSAGV